MRVIEKIKKYNFDIKHLAILFTILISFEIAMFFIFKNALSYFIVSTQEWYQEYSSSRIANYTANSFEMLIETLRLDEEVTATERNKMIQKFDILLNQQLIEKDIEEICLFIMVDGKYKIIDSGEILFLVLIEKNKDIPPPLYDHSEAKKYFKTIKDKLISTESNQTIISEDQTFFSFIPFVPDGELIGVMYVRSFPNFNAITNDFIYNYDAIALVFSILILTGLFFMYLISSNTVNKRDKAQKELFLQKNKHLTEKLNHEKEFVFTKRIYHAHHKAEKIIGFINSDLKEIQGNTETVNRITKYSRYIGRIIYDMKWYEPQLSTIRNVIFSTNVNEVIKFLVDNLFMRLSIKTNVFHIKTQLDANFPIVHVNEFVIWEIIEPLIQNSISHNSEIDVTIKIKTEYNEDKKESTISIEDDGKGISADMLIETNGTKRIFLENISSKIGTEQNFGYGCFIAHNMTKKCGWKLDVENLSLGGCKFEITIKH